MNILQANLTWKSLSSCSNCSCMCDVSGLIPRGIIISVSH